MDNSGSSLLGHPQATHGHRHRPLVVVAGKDFGRRARCRLSAGRSGRVSSAAGRQPTPAAVNLAYGTCLKIATKHPTSQPRLLDHQRHIRISLLLTSHAALHTCLHVHARPLPCSSLSSLAHPHQKRRGKRAVAPVNRLPECSSLSLAGLCAGHPWRKHIRPSIHPSIQPARQGPAASVAGCRLLQSCRAADS